ncbi:hypothetical protein [Pseudonocardia sp. N23]|uniref:hypothetical protein n=1 Tax=Pseudonocardia sp. N23 TaxID=1987376 RepID=UPI000C037D38|nr:hypothetical protein [Pseudonocardia sp. N23]GAY09965.1 hypothetical protein TOK_4321 [Pseudonocardia sp. N23]
MATGEPVLDDTLLLDAAALAAADTGGVLRAAATAGAQVRSAALSADEAGLADLVGHRPRALVLVRRPGASATAAPLVAAMLGPACPVPVVVADTVPMWTGPLDVVVVHTDDATDAELADSIGSAVRRGSDVVLSAPGDGPVAAAGAGRVRLVEPRLPVPRGLDLPRAFAVGLAVTGALGLLGQGPDDRAGSRLDALADALDAEAERNQPGHEPFMNPAKALALRLADHTPLLWGVDAVAAAVAAHGAAALAMHTGVVAHADDVGRAAALSGLRHALESGSGERDVFHDPFDDPAPTAPAPRLMLLATGDDDPGQVLLRRTGRPWPVADVLHPVEEIVRGTPYSVVLRAGVLAARLDIAAVYLGLATRTIEPA